VTAASGENLFVHNPLGGSHDADVEDATSRAVLEEPEFG
jgi:hypothetical protein